MALRSEVGQGPAPHPLRAGLWPCSDRQVSLWACPAAAAPLPAAPSLGAAPAPSQQTRLWRRLWQTTASHAGGRMLPASSGRPGAEMRMQCDVAAARRLPAAAAHAACRLPATAALTAGAAATGAEAVLAGAAVRCLGLLTRLPGWLVAAAHPVHSREGAPTAAWQPPAAAAAAAAAAAHTPGRLRLTSLHGPTAQHPR